MLKVWFPGTNDTEDYGLGGTQWINDNVTISNDGKLGKCLSFNGSNSRLSTTNFELANNWSFACWTKDDPSVTNWRLLIMLNTTGSDADTQMALWLHTGEKRFEVCANGRYVSTVKYIPGQWNHFAATYDGLQIIVYLNGSKVYTLSDTNGKLARHNLTIGARGAHEDGGHSGAASYYYGLVNDLRIWDDQVLSPREVKEISKGLVLHYPLNRGGFGGDNILPNTWAGERTFEYPSSSYYDRWSCVTSIVPTASQYTLSFWAKSTVAGDQIRTHFYSPNTTTTCVSSQGITKQASDGNMTFTLSTEWEHYWVTYSQNETSAVKHVICPRMGAVGNTQGICYGTGTVSIKGLKLEEGSVATPWVPATTDPLYSAMGLDSNVVYDVSGYGHNLELVTESGTALPEHLSDTPRYNVCTKMNGANQYLRCISPTTEAKTASFWVKTGQTGNAAIFTDPKSKLGFGIYSGYIIAACDGYTTTFVLSGFNYNQWNHIVVIKNDDNSRQLYINGVAQAVNSGKTDGWTDAHNYLVLFRRGYSSATAISDCMMSDFRIYATCLSAADVAALYNTPISLSNNGTLMGYEYVEV